MHKTTLTLLLAAVLSSCNAESIAPEVAYRGPQAIDEYLEAFLSVPGGPPSISVAVAVDGELVLSRALGWADTKNEIEATPETRYRTYSVSKAITTLGVLQLVESGDAMLDDPIDRFVPEFPAKSAPISLQHLLSHTSGIRHYRPDAGEISSRVEYGSLTDSLPVFADEPLEFEPGTAYGYTSFGFNLLTGVIEAASGQSFEAYLADRVFEPAGATHSGLDRVASVAAGRLQPPPARAYWKPMNRFFPHREITELPNVSGRYGSSGILSTPTDLARLLVAIEEGTLLQPATRELMYRVPYPELQPSQALGWNVDGEGCDFTVYRSGAGTGFTGLVIHYPELRVGGAVLVNQNQWPDRVALLEGLLEYYAEAARARCKEAT